MRGRRRTPWAPPCLFRAGREQAETRGAGVDGTVPAPLWHDEVRPACESPWPFARLAALFVLGAPLLDGSSPRRGPTGPQGGSPASKIRHDANNVTGISEFMEDLRAGERAARLARRPGRHRALSRRRSSFSLRARSAHYLLGQAQLSAGNLVDAEAAWLKADFVADKGPPEVKAKLLFVIADLRERQKKWDDAKASWQRYADFCSKHADARRLPRHAPPAACQSDRRHAEAGQGLRGRSTAHPGRADQGGAGAEQVASRSPGLVTALSATDEDLALEQRVGVLDEAPGSAAYSSAPGCTRPCRDDRRSARARSRAS